jgi:hypothetical protein
MVAAAIAFVALLGSPSQVSGLSAPSLREVPQTDDEMVVQTSLLEFFKGKEGKLSQWAEGDFVVVRPKWLTKQRGDFDRTLDSLAKHYGHGKNGEKLTRIRQATTYETIPVQDDPQRLSTLRLDERIVLGNIPAESSGVNGARSTRNRVGKDGTVRVSGWLQPPMYSRRGGYAMLVLSDPSHPIGSGGSSYLAVYFVLERREKRWQLDLAVVTVDN